MDEKKKFNFIMIIVILVLLCSNSYLIYKLKNTNPIEIDYSASYLDGCMNMLALEYDYSFIWVDSLSIWIPKEREFYNNTKMYEKYIECGELQWI